MKKLIGIAAAVLALAACAPPQASSVKWCPNSTAKAVSVSPSTKCPLNGWYVVDPAAGGAIRQFFPAAPLIVGLDGKPSKAQDDQPASWVTKFYTRQADGTITGPNVIQVDGPGWMYDPTARETAHGYAADSNFVWDLSV